MSQTPHTLGAVLARPAIKAPRQGWFTRALNLILKRLGRASAASQSADHMLLADDRVGFMKSLRLDAKTAVFDGSNIYHFGHSHDVDVLPLGGLVHQLRDEGYRIVCFFDANIFYTLTDHGGMDRNQRHHPDALSDIFGLKGNEIFVVPSGEPADKYVLSLLKHMPISFAISNDQFRDYGKMYGDVMKGNQWRKGVTISKGQVKLLQHRLKSPVRLG